MYFPLVSVILPAYNHAQFIASAVGSVLSQVYQHWELIVIDDGSTDATWRVLQSFTDPRIQLHHQSNQGSHAAINRGIELAKGDYVSILNSDDLYSPDRLERLLAVAASHKVPCLIVSAVSLIDASGEILPDDHWWNRMYQGILSYWDRGFSARDVLLWGNFAVSTTNFFISKELVAKIGNLGHYRYVLDWEYVIRVALSDPDALVFLRAEKLMYYRLHGSNTILGGAIRNHIEAAHILRSANRELALRQLPVPPYAIDRIRYIERFIRQKESHRRDAKIGETEAYLDLTLQHVEKLELLMSEARKSANDEIARLGAALQKSAALEISQKRDLEVCRSRQIACYLSLNASAKKIAELEIALGSAILDTQVQKDRLAAMENSNSWRISAPLRMAKLNFQRSRRLFEILKRARNEGAPLLRWSIKALAVFGNEGLPGLKRKVQLVMEYQASRHNEVPASIEPNSHVLDAYVAWRATESEQIGVLRSDQKSILDGLAIRPLVSILLPLFNTKPQMLTLALESVENQIYPFWELCICDDASSDLGARRVLDAYLENISSSGRVRFLRRETNGHISRASNDALSMASGDYVLLLDHDDELAPHALLRLVQAINREPQLDLIYSDEDMLDEIGERCAPFFKPDWSPVLLWSQNYVGHLICVRRSLLCEIGGLRLGMEGSQDYDLLLRIGSKTDKIAHIPEVLYHWRRHQDSVAGRPDAKPYAHDAGKRAIGDALRAKYGEQFVRVDDGPYLFVYEARFTIPSQCKASIIIPTRDKVEILSACVDSIVNKSIWQNFEIIIIDNNSEEDATLAYLDDIQAGDSRIQVIQAQCSFNWSRLNNMGASFATGDVLIFLNNDTEVISPDWLERLMEFALLPDVGCIGPLLLYPDNTIQHAGVVVGMGGWADHVFKGQAPIHRGGPYVSNVLSRNVLAVTGACVAIEHKKYQNLGGFDESFEICGSDVELGLRAYRAGLHNAYLATVRLYHHEGKTRSTHVPENDFLQSAVKYSPFREGGDPYYNCNLDILSSTPVIRYPSLPPHLQ